MHQMLNFFFKNFFKERFHDAVKPGFTGVDMPPTLLEQDEREKLNGLKEVWEQALEILTLSRHFSSWKWINAKKCERMTETAKAA
mmetsp:Transcript_114781/g.356492  ORF Transcript_114781/g.356492 Transcript_114781/m.356492 type:complete len:85 (+) Transcript_114781:51-305(+)